MGLRGTEGDTEGEALTDSVAGPRVALRTSDKEAVKECDAEPLAVGGAL